MLRVLVIGVGGNVGVAIVKALRSSTLDVKILGACISEYSPGFALCDDSFLCPLADDKHFNKWLDMIISNENVDIVLSGVEEVLVSLANFTLNSGSVKILLPPKQILETFTDKYATYKWFFENNIDFPKSIKLNFNSKFEYLADLLGLPFILKPRNGKGSSGVSLIYSEKDFLKINFDGTWIAQTYIAGDNNEYTCGVYRSYHGYTKVIVLERTLKNGSTNFARVRTDEEEIIKYCCDIASAIKLHVPFNIQLRKSKKDGKPLCFEINMRLSGTTFIRSQFGFPDLEAWIREAITKVSCEKMFSTRQGIALRYENEFFIDNIPKENLINLTKVRKDIT
ncbi:ATP-grasp domain-containing protein [Amylibacter sp.]|nr:ATP-grasp domain-containing protein [Amylibacter sp.]